ncbi:RNA methyltransferase [bacterium]|nr:RNA methyltransferase [bacterium]
MTIPYSCDTITSPGNPRVRQAAALREADARRDSGLTLVDGRRELSRAVAAGVAVDEVFVAADQPLDDCRPWLADLADGGTRLTPLAERPFAKIAFGSRNEGVVGVVRFGPLPLARARFAADRPLLVIEGVEKPGNLGAILRTADAAGFGVIVCDGRTDPANPAVIRASLGTVFTVPLATTSLVELLPWLHAAGRRVVAATPAGQKLWHETRLAGPAAILLGSEAHGISPRWQQAAADGTLTLETIRLPMRGAADSLNLSATAAVLAYEALRQEEASA